MALNLADPAVSRGFIFTFVGEGGLGKTSLGAAFPNPVFISTEDGLIPAHAERFPLLLDASTCDRSIARNRAPSWRF